MNKATEKLIKKCRKKLDNSCPTRWSSTFLMINRLLEAKSSVISVCEELGWNDQTLSNLQWKQLEMTEKLLKPFAQYITLTSAKESTTISLIIPVLVELEMHLQDEITAKSSVSSIAKKMLQGDLIMLQIHQLPDLIHYS